MNLEYRRQGVHVVFGLFVIVFYFLVGKEEAELLLSLFILLGIFWLNAYLLGNRNSATKWIVENFERKHALPGKGALMYCIGCLFVLLYSRTQSFALAGILLLAFGDGSSTLVGKYGKRTLSWNPKKTWEGVAGFLIAGGIAASFFISIPSAFAASLILGVVESIDTGIDDNLLIPLMAMPLSFLL